MNGVGTRPIFSECDQLSSSQETITWRLDVSAADNSLNHASTIEPVHTHFITNQSYMCC